MNLLVKFPTRGREHRFLDTLGLYRRYLSGRHPVLFLITCDDDDREMNSGACSRLCEDPRIRLAFGPRTTKIGAVNRDMDRAAPFPWDVLLLASDDMLPQVPDYDCIIAQEMAARFPAFDGALWFFDGHVRDFSTLPIMGRRYYEQLGYIYYPGYMTLYADNEYTEFGLRVGRLAFIDRCIILHDHPDHSGKRYDDLYSHNLRRDWLLHDKELFEERRAAGFPT